MASDSVLSPFTAADGENIAIHDWPVQPMWPHQNARGTVIIVHGLGEHALRYAHVAHVFNAMGYHVRAYDQYGHGESGGARGGIKQEMRLVDDLADVIDDSRRSMHRQQNLILLGHSLGGLVVASLVRQKLRPVNGVILSSPALDPGLNMVQKLMLGTVAKLMPDVRVDNGLKVNKLCRDQLVIEAYQQDPFVHRKISGRLARFVADEGAVCVSQATQWNTPTLLLYAGDDALVSRRGSDAFKAAAPTRFVKSHCFEHMYHEILNDPECEQVFMKMRDWVDKLDTAI